MDNYLHIRCEVSRGNILYIKYSNTRSINTNIKPITTRKLIDEKYCLLLLRYSNYNTNNVIPFYDISVKSESINKVKNLLSYSGNYNTICNVLLMKIREKKISDLLY